MFTLFSTIIMMVLLFLTFVFTDQCSNLTAISGIFFVLFIIYCLAVLVPTIAVTVRRLHDSDRSGAWFFINFVPYVGGLALLVLMCLNGTLGTNRFGEDLLASPTSKDML